MRRTTAYSRGDVVLVELIFTDETDKKLRPALVISSDAYQRERQELIIAAITSNVTRRLFGDHRIVDWRAAGLLFPSTVTGILRTIRQVMISRRLGVLQPFDMDSCAQVVRRSLDL